MQYDGPRPDEEFLEASGAMWYMLLAWYFRVGGSGKAQWPLTPHFLPERVTTHDWHGMCPGTYWHLEFAHFLPPAPPPPAVNGP